MPRLDLEDAVARVGEEPVARARWLLRFAYLDLGALSEADAVKLRWEVTAFDLGEHAPRTYPGPDNGLSTKAITLRQDQILRGLRQLKRGEEWELSAPGKRLRARLPQSGHGVTLTTNRTPEFQASLVAALLGSGHRLRVCPAKNCGRFFIKT